MKSSVSKKRTWLLATCIIVLLLLIVMPFVKPADLPYILLFVGRFHPVFLHFPIVLIILALVLELLRRGNMLRNARVLISTLLFVAALSSVIAIISGYLLYGSGDYSGAVLERHMWLGILTGVFIVVTAGLQLFAASSKRMYVLYMSALVCANGAVALASHLGGSLTHGEDYLTEYLPLIAAAGDSSSKKGPPKSEMLVYDHVLMPVFEAKCIACHNDSRSKGELSMTSFEKSLKGGESGIKGIVPGEADSSELYKRIVLPEGHEDRMPPEGKTPMTSYETALFRYWIERGANVRMPLDSAVTDTMISAAVQQVLPDLDRYRRKQEIAKAKSDRLKRDLEHLAFKLNVNIELDSSADEERYAVSMKFPPARLTGEQLRELLAYGEAFSRLSLVASGIEDDGLYHISKMPNVKALFLQKTRINGTGLVYLKNMAGLEVLNLSYTKVDDKQALELLNFPDLREVYLFQSGTSAEVAKALQEYRPSMKVFLEEGPYY